MRNTKLPPYDALHSKLRSFNFLEAEYTEYVNLLRKGMTAEQAPDKLKLFELPDVVVENYQCLEQR